MEVFEQLEPNKHLMNKNTKEREEYIVVICKSNIVTFDIKKITPIWILGLVVHLSFLDSKTMSSQILAYLKNITLSLV